MGHPFLKAALELKLLTPDQAAGFEGAPDPALAVREAGLLDSAACARVVAAATPAGGDRSEPAGRLITKRAPSPDRTATLARPGAPAPPPEDPDLWEAIAPLPEAIGVYRVLGEVARGGMGIVVRAYHPGLDKQVALKLLHPEAQGDRDLEERFLREARAAARLKHPGIVAVHDVARDPEGRIYLVMDLVEGESLKMRLERQGPLEPREAARMVEAVARAVAYAHAQGILHRDLKPHNVLVEHESSTPLLTDFGLAKSVADAGDTTARRPGGGSPAAQELTRAGELVGTPLYMAPEQVEPRRGPTGVRSDVWALGVLLYECLTATTPFEAPGTEEVFRRILHEPPDPASGWQPGLPPELEAIVLRCLEKQPARRYASAEELANELGGWLRGALVLGRGGALVRSGAARRRDGPLPSLLLAALLFLLAGVAWRERETWRAAWAGWAAPPAEPQAVPPPPPPPAPIELPTPAPPPLMRGAPAPEPLHAGNVARLAEAGHPDAMLAYGWALASGQLGASDPVAGRRWMERAAEAGHAQACLVLGTALDQGLHLPRDRGAARSWFQRGAELGQVDCMLGLGALLASDDDPSGARTWLGRAAQAGSLEAMLLLAQLLESGPLPDPAGALSWLRQASQGGDGRAALRLGEVYERGTLGQARNPEEARRWYQLALERGLPEARARLERLGR